MQPNRAQWSLTLALAIAGGQAMAQTPTPPAACTAAEHRQFDFWLGHWIVHGGPDGKALQGTSRIERSENGCWITEHWHSARGSDGTSLNAWDALEPPEAGDNDLDVGQFGLRAGGEVDDRGCPERLELGRIFVREQDGLGAESVGETIFRTGC